jgi:hypothetical protein
LGYGKRLQSYTVDRRFGFVEPFIAPDGIRPTRDVDQRGQQVDAIRPVPALEARIAQFTQRHTRGNARPQIGTGILGPFHQRPAYFVL